MVTWQMKNVLSSLSQSLWSPNLASSWLKMRGSHPQGHVTLRHCGYVTNQKRYISTFTRPIEPKLSRMVTYDKGTLPAKSRDTICLHIHKVQWPQNLVGCWLKMREAHPKSNVTLELCFHVQNKKRHISSTAGPTRCKRKACAPQK